MLTFRLTCPIMSKVEISSYLDKFFESESTEYSEWFGYYNYDPLNYNQSLLLCNRASFDGVKPQKGMKITLGYYNLETKEWHTIGETDSWNWQQGAMMQWLPGVGNEKKVIYNCSKDGHNTAKIVDIETGEARSIDWSIYALTPDGRKSIALEMERSHWCRAYHYQSVSNNHWDGPIVNDDGVFEVDLNNNCRKRIISIQQIVQTDWRPYFQNCKHWVEHIMINPSGTKFCFLHRFSETENVYHYKTRLFIANIDGSNLQVISDWETIDRTHFGWRSDNGFAIYSYTPYTFESNRDIKTIIRDKSFKELLAYSYNRITNLFPYTISRIMNGRHTFYHFYKLDGTNKIIEERKIDKTIFKVDGHPSFSHNGRYMITDSYPWKDGFQRLIIYDIETGKKIVLAKFFAYYNGNPASCDLHPKLCSSNDFVMVDTAYDSRHHMILYKIEWDKIQEALQK